MQFNRLYYSAAQSADLGRLRRRRTTPNYNFRNSKMYSYRPWNGNSRPTTSRHAVALVLWTKILRPLPSLTSPLFLGTQRFLAMSFPARAYNGVISVPTAVRVTKAPSGSLLHGMPTSAFAILHIVAEDMEPSHIQHCGANARSLDFGEPLWQQSIPQLWPEH